MVSSSSAILFGLWCGSLAADVLALQPMTTVRTRPRSTSHLNIIGVETIGIALVSAAAGAVSQQPKIQSLEGELEIAKGALKMSKSELVQKIEELEEKLFQMDNAYEMQSAVFQQEYEEQKKLEVAKITEKLKTDFIFKLDIELEREKSNLLSNQLDDSKSVEQSAKLAELRLRQHQLEGAKTNLEIALKKSDKELGRLQESPKKGGFWSF